MDWKEHNRFVCVTEQEEIGVSGNLKGGAGTAENSMEGEERGLRMLTEAESSNVDVVKGRIKNRDD